MLLRDEHVGAFRRWLLPKLDNISDAEGEILAEYVTALVTSNDSVESLQQNCIESLQDFLQDNTTDFVNDLVEAVKTKSYISRTSQEEANGKTVPGPISSIVGTSISEYAPNPLRAAFTPPANAPKGPAAARTITQHPLPDRPTAHVPLPRDATSGNRQQATRKRKSAHVDAGEAQAGTDSHYMNADPRQRPIKQATRRGGKSNLRAGAAAFQPQNTAAGFSPMPALTPPNLFHLGHLPPPPPGPIPFDMLNNPMALLAMMTAFGTNISGTPSVSGQSYSASDRARNGKCPDWHGKGFCPRGDLLCSFEHEESTQTSNSIPEYDPEAPLLQSQLAMGANQRSGSRQLHKSNGRDGKNRAHVSALGRSYAHNNTKLVVEQIPEKYCTEDEIRSFFSEFGTIIAVEVHKDRRLAIVTFEDHATAAKAYKSPKPVFENRFVKVYWYKNDANRGVVGGDLGMLDDYQVGEHAEESLDPEEFARRQAEAQAAFEERRRRREEVDARAADIERQLQEKDAEMRDIQRQLTELAGDEYPDLERRYSQDLGTLAAEAEDLFAQDKTAPFAGRGRGYSTRGSWRGRGPTAFRSGFSSRGRGRGRGRGAFTSPISNRSSVKRLDNRPRRLAVASAEKNASWEEALRQYLVNMPECTHIEAHPDQADALILTFEQRYQAETFLDNSRRIPDTGPMEISWIPNDAFGGLPASTTTVHADTGPEARAEDGASDGESSGTVGEDVKDEDDEDEKPADLDMDVAEDVDQWL
ncbi:hypothetical protein ACEQ8H_005933 [Pleosporales sp. CAS-2024a]